MSLPRRTMGWSVIVSFSGPTHLFSFHNQDIGSCVHIILDSFAYTFVHYIYKIWRNRPFNSLPHREAF